MSRTWTLPAEDLRLTDHEVHLWRIPLEGHRGAFHLSSLLSPDEAARADRFYFEKDRRRFAIARGAMRQILGRYLETQPEKLVFSYAEKGKPELSPNVNPQDLKFNLSHSRELALLAVVRRFPLGVDIESVNHEFANQEIAERYFSANEVSTLLALDPRSRAEAFFECWTRKEAYIKALGEGLFVSLDSFSVAFGPDVPAALQRVETAAEEVSRWSMYDVIAGPDYKAALVIEGKGHRLRQWQWEPKAGRPFPMGSP